MNRKEPLIQAAIALAFGNSQMELKFSSDKCYTLKVEKGSEQVMYKNKNKIIFYKSAHAFGMKQTRQNTLSLSNILFVGGKLVKDWKIELKQDPALVN
jgi:hypothetical protein